MENNRLRVESGPDSYAECYPGYVSFKLCFRDLSVELRYRRPTRRCYGFALRPGGLNARIVQQDKAVLVWFVIGTAGQ